MKRRTAEQILNNVFYSPDGCWYWTGCTSQKGYGVAVYKGDVIRAHRLSYLHHIGEIKHDNVIMHTCDNRLCINPFHLKQGTQLENIKDRQRKGRMARGHNIHRTKLTKVQVIAIRDAKRNGFRNKDIASYFKIAECTVSNIVANRWWNY